MIRDCRILVRRGGSEANTCPKHKLRHKQLFSPGKFYGRTENLLALKGSVTLFCYGAIGRFVKNGHSFVHHPVSESYANDE